MRNDLKIALIKADRNDYSYVDVPLSILSLASYLVEKKIIPKKNIILLDIDLKDPLREIKYFQPDIVGISATTGAYPVAIRLGRRIREAFNTPLIIGGIHISVFPHNLRKPFDIGVVGEGEQTLAELIQLYDKKNGFDVKKLLGTKGLVFKNKGKLIVTKKRPLIYPLDNIPSLNWFLLPKIYFRYQIIRVSGRWKILKYVSMFTMRGCPYNCIFCARKSIWKKVRFFSPERVVNDFEVLVKKHKVEAIRLWDPTFTMSRERIKKIIKLMRERKILGKLVFPQVYVRADTVDLEMLKLLRIMGVVSLIYGFESGSDRVLKMLKKNTTTVAINKRAVELTSGLDIDFSGCFMFASPKETKKEMEKTLRFIKWLASQRNLLVADITRTIPYPGTELWNYALKRGIVSDNMDWSKFLMETHSKRMCRPFFLEKIDRESFKIIWKQARRLYFEIKKKNEKEEEYQRVLRLQKWLIKKEYKNLGFFLVWNDFKNKRYSSLVRRIYQRFYKK